MGIIEATIMKQIDREMQRLEEAETILKLINKYESAWDFDTREDIMAVLLKNNEA